MRDQYEGVKVLRGKGIPHNVDIVIEDEPDRLTITFEERLISSRGAIALETVLNQNVQYWRRIIEDRDDGPNPQSQAS